MRALLFGKVYLLGQNDKAGKNSGDSKGSPNSIDQIEQLQLPKRMEKRRTVYLGEQLSCWLRYEDFEIQVDAIDLSSRGIALVETWEKIEFPCAVGQKISLEFEKGLASRFTIDGQQGVAISGSRAINLVGYF